MVVRFFRSASPRSFFPRRGVAVTLLAVGLAATGVAQTQQSTPSPTPAPASAAPGDLPAGTSTADQTPTAVLSNSSNTPKRGRTRKSADDTVKQSKDSVKDAKQTEKTRKQQMKLNPLGNVKSGQPDKQLYDKAMVAINKGHYEVARLDLQTMLSTYPDSEFQMRAKLAFADSWYREGGSGALAQAETEYHDFIIFFPNAPEAAEAQMRIGDIYFKQMDRPDRDYTKVVHAQDEYRNMLNQYPDSTLIPEAKQKLREVQEVMAQRETGIGDHYARHENWVAAIARYQTVIDTYPLYSHIDQTLISLGDAYAAQARYVRSIPNLSEDSRARLLKVYDDQAAAAYGRVVLQYAASPHMEDARDRLEAMSVPIPEPSAEQIAASQALEDSRQTYSLANRAKGLIFRGPDTVQAARIGDPAMADPKATTAPEVSKRAELAYKTALQPAAPTGTPLTPTTLRSDEAAAADSAKGSALGAAASPSLQDIPASDAATTSGTGVGTGFTTTPPGVAPLSTGGGSTSTGVTILTPGVTTATPTGNGLNAVGPANTTALPPIEHAAEAPDAVNDVAGAKTPQGQAPVLDKKGNAKKTKPDYDKSDESSSTHKRKKGLKKLDPL